jgi:hypothetical protein
MIDRFGLRESWFRLSCHHAWIRTKKVTAHENERRGNGWREDWGTSVPARDVASSTTAASLSPAEGGCPDWPPLLANIWEGKWGMEVRRNEKLLVVFGGRSVRCVDNWAVFPGARLGRVKGLGGGEWFAGRAGLAKEQAYPQAPEGRMGNQTGNCRSALPEQVLPTVCVSPVARGLGAVGGRRSTRWGTWQLRKVPGLEQPERWLTGNSRSRHVFQQPAAGADGIMSCGSEFGGSRVPAIFIPIGAGVGLLCG